MIMPNYDPDQVIINITRLIDRENTRFIFIVAFKVTSTNSG